MSSPGLSLCGKVCLVTGATRGIGKGIALQLGQAGATVYITGRTLKKKGPHDKGSLEDTVAEIEQRGGKCIPIVCDHAKDEDVQRLFDQVKMEQNGQLDVLVNNAYSAVTVLGKYINVPFWEQPLSMWDDVNQVGLRNHYLCTVHAARLMVPRKKGLIVNVSSAGGLRYVFNVSYGIGKEALDRMAADCAVELRKHNVAVVSLWPTIVRTELVSEIFEKSSTSQTEKSGFSAIVAASFNDGSESIEYSGKAVVHLAADSKIMSKSGRVLITQDLGSEYGFSDVDGKTPNNIRSLSYLLGMRKYWLASYIPRWVKVPGWVLHLGGNKL